MVELLSPCLGIYLFPPVEQCPFDTVHPFLDTFSIRVLRCLDELLRCSSVRGGERLIPIGEHVQVWITWIVLDGQMSVVTAEGVSCILTTTSEASSRWMAKTKPSISRSLGS